MARYDYPCKDCTDRAVGCHSKCEKYLAARIDHKQKEAVILREKAVYDGMDNYVITTIKKAKKRRER